MMVSGPRGRDMGSYCFMGTKLGRWKSSGAGLWRCLFTNMNLFNVTEPKGSKSKFCEIYILSQ